MFITSCSVWRRSVALLSLEFLLPMFAAAVGCFFQAHVRPLALIAPGHHEIPVYPCI